MLVEIANATCRKEFNVSVCVTRSTSTLANELNSNPSLYVLKRKSRFDIQGFRSLKAATKAQHVDLFHVHGRSSFSFLAFASIFGIVNVPIILHDHTGWIEVDHSIPLWFRILGKPMIAHYVGVHEKLGQWAQAAGIPSKRISVIENSLDLSRFHNVKSLSTRRELNIEGHQLLGVMVGGSKRQKGFSYLIEALSKCKNRNNIKFLVVGAVNERDYFQACQEKISSLGFRDSFIFTGPRTDIPALFNCVDFAVLPSLSESGPLVLIEYMASGIPIVAFQTGSISHRASKLGLQGFIPPNDVETFSKALDEISTISAEERSGRGAIGKEIAYQHFDIHKTMPRWYEIYSSALSSKTL